MTFDLESLPPSDAYHLLVNTVVPRPIALVTSLDAEGRANAAPFSFFNVMGHDPPLLVLGIERGPAGAPKDTAANVRATGEFVVNLVCESIAERMNRCSVAYPRDVDEAAESGLSHVPSSKVSVPGVRESPVRLECREFVSLGVGDGRTLIVGRIVAITIADAHYDPASRRVDTPGLRLIGRMHGDGWYVRTTDLFRMRKP